MSNPCLGTSYAALWCRKHSQPSSNPTTLSDPMRFGWLLPQSWDDVADELALLGVVPLLAALLAGGSGDAAVEWSLQ